jgi:D-alanyl-D-alanine carboxypeptidase
VLTSSGFADTLPVAGFRETLPYDEAFSQTRQLPVEGIIDASRLKR